MEPTPDFIIIGAGSSGLQCALEVASSHDSDTYILLLEQSSSIGGSLTPHFLEETQTFLDSSPQLSSSVFKPFISELTSRHGITPPQTLKLSPLFRYHLPNGYVDIPSSLHDFEFLLCSLCPSQEKQIKSTLNRLISFGHHYSDYFLSDSFLLSRVLTFPFKGLSRTDFFLHFHSSLESFVSTINSPLIVALINSFCFLIGTSPSKISVIYFGYYLINLFKGSEALINTSDFLINMSSRIRELGVVVKLDTKVDGLITEKPGIFHRERVVGVETNKGDYHCTKGVIDTAGFIASNPIDRKSSNQSDTSSLRSSFYSLHIVVNNSHVRSINETLGEQYLHFLTATKLTPTKDQQVCAENAALVECTAIWEGQRVGNVESCPVIITNHLATGKSNVVNAFFLVSGEASATLSPQVSSSLLFERISHCFPAFRQQNAVFHMFHQTPSDTAQRTGCSWGSMPGHSFPFNDPFPRRPPCPFPNILITGSGVDANLSLFSNLEKSFKDTEAFQRSL
ncbi:hypothetical protein P9112_009791 [Eukaryota sp. TZLM1-RC]